MAKQTIKLKKYVDIINEYKAGGAVNPGNFLVLGSAGTVTAGVPVEKMVALEDELQGRSINDAFAAGEPIQCWSAVSGEEALVVLATGQTIVIGNKLEVNASGQVVVAATGTAVAVALEAVTTTTATAFIKVRFI